MIARDPDLALDLSRIPTAEPFANALIDATKQHGIAFDDAAREIVVGNRTAALGERLENWPPSSRRNWQPLALDRGPSGAELVWGCGALRADIAFHEQTVMALRALPINRLFAVRTPLTADFVAALEADALPVRGLVFHMSRCGSTLIAQALKTWPGVRVLSEPAVLDTAINLARAGQDPEWLAFRAVVAAFAQPAGADRDVVFKLDAWHALALADIRQHLQTAWLFAYRDPVEVLVSHACEPGWHTVPGMLSAAWLPTPESVRNAQTPLRHGARVIGAICAAVVPHADAPNLLNYEEFPHAWSTRVARAFNLDPAAADSDALAALLTRHAKHPYELYVDDCAKKRAAATTEIRAAAEQWIAPHYAALEKIRCGGES